MSETTTGGSWFRRLRTTPLRDLLRGRLSARLDVAAQIDLSGLPEPARALISRVVRRTRLWRLERADVADELIAHFADGIEAGTSIDRLIASFGDQRRAARLIRRAKKRNRPLVWHVLRGLGWIIVSLVAFYVLLAAYFYAGHPSPRVDYLSALNEPVVRIPPEERAWPMYRRVLLSLRFADPKAEEARWKLLEARPGNARWSELTSYLRSHADALALARQASRKPSLGFVFGPGGSANDVELYQWPNGSLTAKLPSAPTPVDGSMIAIMLPHLFDLHMIAEVLAIDAILAREESDPARVEQDLLALLDLARQLRTGGCNVIVTQLVALGIDSLAVNEVERLLADHPSVLNEDAIQRLALRLSEPRCAADLMSYSTERATFYDAIQRTYTDDGSGSGRLTPRGLRFLTYAQAINGSVVGDTREELKTVLSGPAVLLLVASRRDLVNTYDHLIDEMEAELHKPLAQESQSVANRQLRQWKASTLSQVRYLPLVILAPALERLRATAERYLGQRDGLVVGIALELYRRHHGTYPSTLDALVPALLPSIPVDRITGEPVHYRLIGGKPIIYSCGADRDDDGGRPPAQHGNHGGNFSAAVWGALPANAPDGDWILFPEPPREAD